MRWITHKLVDAFPELDEFPLAQRIAFLNRAVWSWWVALLPFVIAGTSVLLSFFGTVFLADAIERMYSSPDLLWTGEQHWLALFGLIILLFPLCIGGLVYLLARDWLCKQRIRQIIRSRFHCAACRYKLAGLQLSQDNAITCPECGLTQKVHPSLQELSQNKPAP